MLVRFRFGNFRCFKDDQELSLVAAKKSEATIAVERPRLDLLRTAAIFGANASGKSSVLQALFFVKEAVRSSFQWEPEALIPLQANALAAETPSWFEVVFVLGGVLYEYKVRINRHQVLEEKLLGSRGRRYLLFERTTAEGFSFGNKLQGRNSIIADLTRPNCLFLSAAAQHGHPELSEVYGWFANNLHFSNNSGRKLQMDFTLSEVEEPQKRDEVLRMLQRADFEIARLELQPSKRLVLVHSHQGKEFELGLGAESEGTQVFFAFAGPLLWCLRNGSALCVDEIDSSLHPLLVREIVRLFQDPVLNPNNAQLIFNTHDSTLLGNFPGNTPLSRDEVWFTERLPEGGSKLFPLSDFETKKDDNLERRYLLGRYGALPDLRLFEVGEN